MSFVLLFHFRLNLRLVLFSDSSWLTEGNNTIQLMNQKGWKNWKGCAKFKGEKPIDVFFFLQKKTNCLRLKLEMKSRLKIKFYCRFYGHRSGRRCRSVIEFSIVFLELSRPVPFAGRESKDCATAPSFPDCIDMLTWRRKCTSGLREKSINFPSHGQWLSSNFSLSFAGKSSGTFANY